MPRSAAMSSSAAARRGIRGTRHGTERSRVEWSGVERNGTERRNEMRRAQRRLQCGLCGRTGETRRMKACDGLGAN